MEILFEKDLKNTKNLLAFSAGVDSTALFYLLAERQIPFDVAFVRYNTRKQCILEESRARMLCFSYRKKCYCKNAPFFKNNFEYNARDFRYLFFDSLMEQFGYENLLLAHQLNDKLEWFFMQFYKGSELDRMLLRSSNQRHGYRIIRPILHLSREEILEYLNRGGYFYFEDYSNKDEKFLRNAFRSHLSQMTNNLSGVQKSFELLEESLLSKKIKRSFSLKKLTCFYFLDATLRDIDIASKNLGYCLRFRQQTLLKEVWDRESFSLVFGGKIIVEKSNNWIFIAPFLETKKLSKDFRERCRVLKIPKKIRYYFYAAEIHLDTFVLYRDKSLKQ